MNEENMYFVQRQAPAGNWVDTLGVYMDVKGWETVSMYARAETAKGQKIRIVTKKTTIVQEFTK